MFWAVCSNLRGGSQNIIIGPWWLERFSQNWGNLLMAFVLFFLSSLSRINTYFNQISKIKNCGKSLNHIFCICSHKWTFCLRSWINPLNLHFSKVLFGVCTIMLSRLIMIIYEGWVWKLYKVESSLNKSDLSQPTDSV